MRDSLLSVECSLYVVSFSQSLRAIRNWPLLLCTNLASFPRSLLCNVLFTRQLQCTTQKTKERSKEGRRKGYMHFVIMNRGPLEEGVEGERNRVKGKV